MANFVMKSALSNRWHLSYDVHLEVNREDYQNCSVFCCVWQLYPIICKTKMNSSYGWMCSFRFLFGRPYYRSCLWYTVSSVCCLSVCLSVTFCIVAKWYVLAKNCLKEWIANQGPLHSTPLTGRAVKAQRQGHIGRPIAQPWGGGLGVSVCMRVV